MRNITSRRLQPTAEDDDAKANAQPNNVVDELPAKKTETVHVATTSAKSHASASVKIEDFAPKPTHQSAKTSAPAPPANRVKSTKVQQTRSTVTNGQRPRTVSNQPKQYSNGGAKPAANGSTKLSSPNGSWKQQSAKHHLPNGNGHLSNGISMTSLHAPESSHQSNGSAQYHKQASPTNSGKTKQKGGFKQRSLHHASMPDLYGDFTPKKNKGGQ